MANPIDQRIKYKVIVEALEGEIECGDQYLVKETPEGTLIAVADGLGHGEDASIAAKKAMEIIEDNSQKSIEHLFKLCNESMHNTRGAALTIVHIDLKHILTYMTVGNVTGVCWRLSEIGKLDREAFYLEGGIVGYRFPTVVRTKQIQMAAGDILILATDGINTLFENEPAKLAEPDEIAQYVFNTYRNKRDDGLVLVAKLM